MLLITQCYLFRFGRNHTFNRYLFPYLWFDNYPGFLCHNCLGCFRGYFDFSLLLFRNHSHFWIFGGQRCFGFTRSLRRWLSNFGGYLLEVLRHGMENRLVVIGCRVGCLLRNHVCIPTLCCRTSVVVDAPWCSSLRWFCIQSNWFYWIFTRACWYRPCRVYCVLGLLWSWSWAYIVLGQWLWNAISWFVAQFFSLHTSNI